MAIPNKALPTRLLSIPTVEIRSMVSEAVDLSIYRKVPLHFHRSSPRRTFVTLCYGVMASVEMAFKKESSTHWLF